jgi:hypothetical protein
MRLFFPPRCPDDPSHQFVWPPAWGTDGAYIVHRLKDFLSIELSKDGAGRYHVDAFVWFFGRYRWVTTATFKPSA